MKVYYIIPLNYRLTEHPENFKIRTMLSSGQIKPSTQYYREVTCLCFIYVSSETTNFQKDLFLKEYSEDKYALFYFLYNGS